MDCLWRGRDGVERRLERWDPYISPLALDVISFFFPAEPVSAPAQFGRDANQPINCASRLSAHCARVGCRTIPHAATTSRSSRQPISHVSSPDMRQTCLLDYPRLFLVGVESYPCLRWHFLGLDLCLAITGQLQPRGLVDR